jgi:Tol biopolymer transport system component
MVDHIRRAHISSLADTLQSAAITAAPARRFRALALFVALAVGAAFGTPGAQASFPGRNGALSVSYVFDCVGQIATLEPDGRPLRTLTSPTCAPTEAIFLGTMGRASWSPDGRQLTFDYTTRYAANTDPYRFAVMNADGSARRDVPLAPVTAPNPFTHDMFWLPRWDPTFTADGERLLYTRLGLLETGSEIWSARLDGSDDRRIGAGQLARMSPDGRQIAYELSPRPVTDITMVPDSAIGLMNANTGMPIRRLWRGSVRSIDWSPNGKRIVFTGSRSSISSPADVYVVRADGTALRRLTSTAKASETDAVWSPDGRRIAFVREITRGYAIAEAIWTLRPNGAAERRIRKPWIRHQEDIKDSVQISWQPLPAAD